MFINRKAQTRVYTGPFKADSPILIGLGLIFGSPFGGVLRTRGPRDDKEASSSELQRGHIEF